MRMSFIKKNIEAVFHISSYWIKIRLYTKNQLPRLLITALIVISPCVAVLWWWSGGMLMVWWFILTDNNTTPTKGVLSCFGLLVGLWQYYDTYYIISYLWPYNMFYIDGGGDEQKLLSVTDRRTDRQTQRHTNTQTHTIEVDFLLVVLVMLPVLYCCLKLLFYFFQKIGSSSI